MSISKVKTIALALLVLINIIFLSVIVIDTLADSRSERAALDNVSAVMRAGGINIDPGIIYTGDADISSAVTALLGFLAAVRDESREDVWSSSIYGVELIHGDSCEHENCDLGLMWMIIADSANNPVTSYLIDSSTGDITETQDKPF